MALVDMCGGVYKLTAEEDNEICQLVLEVYTHQARREVGDKIPEGKLSRETEQQLRDKLTLAIIDNCMKSLIDYLSARGLYYQINVQRGQVFVPNVPRSLRREIMTGDIRDVVCGFEELPRGQIFQQALDFDGIQLY